MTPEETLKTFLNSKFIRADRSNGYIKPTTMKITDFDAALAEEGTLSFWSSAPRLWAGIYLLCEDGTVQNVNRQVLRLYKAGLLESGPKRGSLRVKENR